MKITKKRVEESVDSIYNHAASDDDFITYRKRRYSEKCSHEFKETILSLSEAGNIVAKRKCIICGEITDNYIFRPVVAEHFDDELGWSQE